MKIIFMGTPDFAVPIFSSLLTAHEVVAAVTQPDRPSGRGQAVQYTPVKKRALEAGVPVLQPPTLRDKPFALTLQDYGADAFVVAAYGLILPVRILNMPRYGCINVHASLLPKYRGAAPMHYALLNGEAVTGVTIMYMDKGIDTGDMLLQRELPIRPKEKLSELHDRMAQLGGECILEALAQIVNGTAVRTVQDAEAASYAPMINKEDGCIDWCYPSARIFNMTRALTPWPGTYTQYKGSVLKIWDCELAGAGLKEDGAEGDSFSGSGAAGEVNPGNAEPGTVLAVDKARGLLVKTGDSALWVTELQAVGGKRMKAADYLRGRPMEIGTVLGF